MNSTHPYYMPMLHKHLRLQGTELPHFITSVGNCCPSRTVVLTGRHCHNNNLTANDPPHGGYAGFKTKKLDKSYLPLWLQAAGYQTYWVGKALNGFSTFMADKYGCLPGWDHLMPSVGPPTQADLDEFQAGLAQRPPVYLKYYYTNCQYHERKVGLPDDNLFERAHSLIEDSVDSGNPFFLKLAVSAPHDGPVDGLPRIADRYLSAFPGLKVPRGPNYGKPIDDRFGMSKQRPLWWDSADSDIRYRARAQSMLAIDEHLDKLVTKLECLGILNNTYIIYTSDNGFKLGQHNIPQEKWTYYEEDVALPFFIRGPGVPRGAYANTVQAAMVDVTATILNLAGAAPPANADPVDGAPLPFDLLRTLHSQPNSPFYSYKGAYWNAAPGTVDMLAPPATDAATCARSARPPPMPPLPPRPPPCKGGKCKPIDVGSDDDDSENALLNRLASYDAENGTESGSGSGRRMLRNGAAAATGTELEGAEAEADELRRQLAEATMVMELEEEAEEERERRALQAAGSAAGRISTWSNMALIEQWKYGNLWRGKDYRVIRACMPPNATIAASAAGTRRTGNVCYKYVVFCNIERAYGALRLNQLFNLSSDEAEVNDLLLKKPLPTGTQRLVDRLDAALTVLSYCSGFSCAQPFTRIHPDGSVVNLAEAMDPKYDSLYAGFKKLDFYRCAEYYDPANEIPDSRLVPEEWTLPGAAPPPRPPTSTLDPYVPFVKPPKKGGGKKGGKKGL
ncbi:hypothetical protein CHLRE_04g226050v5 [Chlamydomonas reinhardtii]|uniref:Sulfatase N-terminal domain-containing protein n=1 Tax=Chlamydomonas reinhardtii TaxID=3055 RepID=A0A2K3DUM3_CHLRE|nr:uncharacterized protein CHLRE_04g226050v5 [Chlamydomonas reinhardtii]PNW84226.1 hypothetical protein CHLRE_04g226050v5 [Chlamydomonas reinhardtii]